MGKWWKQEERLSNKQIKAMLGTEFTYVFDDGDKVQAYVKAWDPKVGMTMMSLSDTTEDGWTDDDTEEPDGTFCICSADLRKGSNNKKKMRKYTMNRIIQDLIEIRDTGELHEGSMNPFGNNPECVF